MTARVRATSARAVLFRLGTGHFYHHPLIPLFHFWKDGTGEGKHLMWGVEALLAYPLQKDEFPSLKDFKGKRKRDGFYLIYKD